MTMANEITAPGGSGSVLLTGGASAVGRAAIRQFLAAGYRVFAAVDNTDSARAIRADGAIPVYPNLLRAGEVRAAIDAAGADIVVNLAPQAANHGLPAEQWGADWIALITRGTQAIMEAATAAGVKFVVHTSPLFAGGHGESEAAAALIDAARTGEQLVLGCASASSTALNRRN
jgi:nucleoside-diphosphate-sugar epimerase